MAGGGVWLCSDWLLQRLTLHVLRVLHAGAGSRALLHPQLRRLLLLLLLHIECRWSLTHPQRHVGSWLSTRQWHIGLVAHDWHVGPRNLASPQWHIACWLIAGHVELALSLRMKIEGRIVCYIIRGTQLLLFCISLATKPWAIYNYKKWNKGHLNQLPCFEKGFIHGTYNCYNTNLITLASFMKAPQNISSKGYMMMY